MNEEAGSKRAKSRWRFLLSPAALMRLAILVAIGPLLGLFGKHHWFLDLFNHLQAQYFVALLIITLVLCLWRKPKHAIIAVLALTIPTARLAELYRKSAIHDDGATLRIASYNVRTSNQRYADTIAWILKSDPEFIYLTECNPTWIRELAPLGKRFPHSVDTTISGNFGFSFHSKHPILTRKIHPIGQLALPLLEARIQTPHGVVTVFGCHPVPPVNEFWASERNLYLAELDRLGNATEGHSVILGDLNATRWSYQMKPILEDFTDTQQGHGYSATWMRSNWLVTIPIDHILSRGFRGTITRETGPELGSDHRPVIAELAW